MNGHLLIGLCLLGSAYGQVAQTTINLATQGRNADFSAFPFTRPIAVGTVLPATCQVGQLFFNSSALPGANLYGCTNVNAWTALSGSTSTPTIALAPVSLSFGSPTVGTSTPKSVTLTNTGASFLAVSGITLTGTNASDFLTSNTCGSTVPSGASCTISVTFKPAIVGAESASVNIAGNQPGSPSTISLSGTGAAAVTSGGLVVTPSAAFAGENGTVTLTANRPVNWSLAKSSSGTLIANSSTSATYTAPASIGAQEAVGGCQVMPNDAVYNTAIDNLPVESRSSLWTANMGANGISFFASWGTNIADATTPVKSMSFFYTPLYNGPFVMPQWPSLKRQGGTFTTRLNGTDHHIATVRRDNCQFYETYGDYFVPATCRDGVTPGCTAQSGLTYSWNTYALPLQGSTDAAGLPLLPLTLRLSEIKSGAVNHAMRFTLSAGFIQALAYWPANSTNGCKSCINSPPYGARFRLKASYDISKFSQTAQVILTALKRYGMFLADVGLGPTIETDTDVSEDQTAMAALSEIAGAAIIINNFEAVDESSLMMSNTSAQVNPTNTYQTPSNFAAVQPVDQANSNYQVNLPIPLQSVLVGLPSPTMVIVAGMSGYQLTSWVNGTPNQNVTWSFVSGVGSVTPAGVYTPPASVTGPASALLQVTSAADTNAFSRLYVTVIPTGANPAGSIRIDSGSWTGLTDGSGNLWLPDLGSENGGYNSRGGDYPNWASLANSPEKYVYQSAAYTYGFDMVYSLVVPNGNYKVRYMFGQIYNGCNTASCVTYNPNSNVTSHWPLHIEANGQIALHNFNWGLPTNYAYATPIDVFIPAKVVDNKLYTAIRINLPDVVTQASPLPMINGLEIIPDNNTTPYLAIDTQQQTSVAAGSTLQLYSVGWYMSNAATWSVSGPGSIDQNGLYTAPATAGSVQTVTITATSTSNPSVTATTTLTIPASGS